MTMGDRVGPGRDVVRFWRLVEMFTAQTVQDLDPRNATHPVDDWSTHRSLPWPSARRKPDARSGFRWLHTVYLGVYPLAAAYEHLHAAFPEDRDAYDERPLGSGACAAVVVDDDGRMIAETVTLSSALWGLGRLHSVGLSSRDWMEGLDVAGAALSGQFHSAIAARHNATGPDAEPTAGIDSQLLLDFLQTAHAVAGIAQMSGVCTSDIRVASSWVPRDSDPEPPFLNSFFLDDLATVATSSQWGQALRSFLTLPHEVDVPSRVDVRVRTDVVVAGTSINRMPLGRWLSNPKWPLASSQQFAVNEAISTLGPAAGLLGVNGPPGTGKTTMLRDIVAANVVARAERLSALTAPEQAFVAGKTYVAKMGSQTWSVPQLKPEFTGFEMVVGSFNNTAVANVSNELPRRTAIHETWSGADYFADIAGLTSRSSAKDEPVPAWALIAARLGNAKNRNDFDNAFWKGTDSRRRPDGSTTPEVSGFEGLFKAWKDGSTPRPSWTEARKAFQNCRATVIHLIAERTIAERRLHDAADLTRRCALLEHEIRDSHERAAELRRQQEAAAHELQLRQHDTQLSAQQRDRHLDLRPSAWWSLLTFGAASRAWQEELKPLNQQLDRQDQAVLGASRLLDECVERTRHLGQQQRELHHQAQTLDERRTQLAVMLEDDAKRFGPCHPGPTWRADEHRRELNGAWLDPALNRARSDLFEAAMNLHQAFIANTPRMHGYLIAATKIVRGAVPKNLDPQARLAGWQLFFMTVPLISTTFASIGRMLQGLESEALGWLLIDEAGQAPPQSAVGAIWRARRVLAVGDPMQLTPIVTIPRKTQEALATHSQVDGVWVPSTTSVQQLADRVGRYGTELPHTNGTSVWVSAPLRVHRRCGHPMFDISNEIAYDNLMINGVHATDDSQRFADLPPSKWTHVAASPGSHLQRPEMDKLAEIVTWLLRQNIVGSDIIAISPFRAVANELQKFARTVEGMSGGTIHTAQGREAGIVFLVLGGDPAKPGAKRWASETPNLVNVAASRAKHRLYVLGDRSTWSQQPYFSVLDKLLGQ